jgi:tetratricopeptide (TPR) repeat protein
MKNPVDLRPWMDEWPYDPENNVRVVRGAHGREILQVRLPLGLEQYEMEGRPDGQRPHGHESALEYQLQRQAQAAGHDLAFRLSAEDCAELFAEGVLYYYRYLQLFQIKDWKRTIRDTERNLKVFDLVHQCAEREEDQQYLEQWRPYILRIHTIARAMIELEQGKYTPALEITQQAIEVIENLPGIDQEVFTFERQRSLTALRELAAQLKRNRPLTKLERLERSLRQAIKNQAFERAAKLRDEIRVLRNAEASPQQDLKEK